MKNVIKIFGLCAFILLSAQSIFSQTADSLKMLEQYSLFSEYHKNKDYKSAVPYGWNVIEMDSKRFAKWVYYKMEDALWQLRDSSDISEEDKAAIEDTMMAFYDIAAENYPDAKGYFQVRKAFVAETWLEMDADQVIGMYEAAITSDPNISSYYYDRLGELYKANMDENEEYKSKALDLYTELSKKEPENGEWPEKLEGLVDNIDELVDLFKKQWDLDPENLEKAWKYASTAIKANRFEEAIVPLEFLTSKEPETINYWNQLATAYQKSEQISKAEDVYQRLIELEPDNKNHYLNLGIIFMEAGQLSAARNQFQKASQVGDNWGLPIYYEGLLYERAARNCEFNFEAQLVYQLAVDTYRRAQNIDPSVSQAQERIGALSSSVPTQEDYFFRDYKSGQTVPIPNNGCYAWIGKSVTVP